MLASASSPPPRAWKRKQNRKCPSQRSTSRPRRLDPSAVLERGPHCRLSRTALFINAGSGRFWWLESALSGALGQAIPPQKTARPRRLGLVAGLLTGERAPLREASLWGSLDKSGAGWTQGGCTGSRPENRGIHHWRVHEQAAGDRPEVGEPTRPLSTGICTPSFALPKDHLASFSSSSEGTEGLALLEPENQEDQNDPCCPREEPLTPAHLRPVVRAAGVNADCCALLPVHRRS